MKAKFYDLLANSTVCQAFLTIGFSGTILALSLLGRPIQEELWQALWAILGFWFGSKITQKQLAG